MLWRHHDAPDRDRVAALFVRRVTTRPRVASRSPLRPYPTPARYARMPQWPAALHETTPPHGCSPSGRTLSARPLPRRRTVPHASPARLAIDTGAPPLPVHCWFTPDGWGFDVDAPIDITGGVQHTTQALASRFAAGIAAHSAGWHMLQPVGPPPPTTCGGVTVVTREPATIPPAEAWLRRDASRRCRWVSTRRRAGWWMRWSRGPGRCRSR
ncbi:hypothetical protein ABIA39_001749 [Nocardia sp. GAS34]